MAEIDKNNPMSENPVEEQDINVEIETPTDISEEEDLPAEEKPEDFYKNLAEDLDERVLGRIASRLIQDFRQDKVSRQDWEQTYRNGLDLLGFKYQDQTRPFQGASGVTHPMLAESVTQFQAQAYKELLPPEGPVRTQIVGAPDRAAEEQAKRVQDFMNYMLMEEMEEYTPEFDQLLFYLPISGSTFKKIYYDEIMQRAVAKFIPAEDLVVPYYATDLKDCERITHIIKMSDNEILKKQRAGFYRDIELPTKQPEQSDLKQKLDEIEGVKPTGEAEYQHNVLEMHVDLDISEFESFGGEKSKNIKVPYIVTIDEGSQEILSIYRNYDPEDELQRRIEYFVHYKFLPGLGFYGFGLIHMIGGLSRTATSALRQLLDAGTLANLPAGFKSRGIRIRDDDQPFQPGEFRDVDAPGGNIKDQFQILPFKEPSQTLFQLLGFVVQAGQRFASIADMQLGEDTANRAVGTTIALLERGSRVMSAIHKRIYYTMKQEFRLLSDVFGTYLPPVYPYAVYGADRMVKGADFDDRVDVIPVADPNIFSMAQRFTLAQTQLQIAQSNPQIHDLREAYRRVYESMGTRQIDLLMPPEQPPVPQDPAVENAKALQTQPLQVFPDQDHEAHIAAHATFIQSRMVQVNPIVYALLQGHISDHISQKAQSDVAALVSQSEQLAMLAEQDPAGFQTQFNSLVAKKIVELTVQLIQAEGGTQKEDPLIALKQRELDLKAMDIQRRAQENAADMDRKMSEFEDTSDLERLRLETQDQQSTDRLKIAKEKLALQAKAQQDKANAIKKG